MGCWSDMGRQTRENLIKECLILRDEISTLWREVREVPGKREEGETGEEMAKAKWKSRREFGYRVRCSVARPSSISIQDLLDERYSTGVALKFVKATRVGVIKEGAGLEAQGVLFPFLLMLAGGSPP